MQCLVPPRKAAPLARGPPHGIMVAMHDGGTPMARIDDVLAHIDANLEPALERLFALLRIKSISTDPAYAADCRAYADWHAADLRRDRLRRRRAPTRRATRSSSRTTAARGGPSALFYGHYDVQPVDPLELWDHDPFEPKIETLPDGTKVIRGRGASDDKGQLMAFVEACRAWKAVTGSLPIPVTILLEGEEESGGVNLPPLPRSQRGRAEGRYRPDLRHQHVGRGDAGDRHHAARPLRRGGDHPRRRPRPAFRLLRLGRGQPEPRPGADPRRPA